VLPRLVHRDMVGSKCLDSYVLRNGYDSNVRRQPAVGIWSQGRQNRAAQKDTFRAGNELLHGQNTRLSPAANPNSINLMNSTSPACKCKVFLSVRCGLRWDLFPLTAFSVDCTIRLSTPI
jgi:hypothetical protein